jgi:hypothetical protein
VILPLVAAVFVSAASAASSPSFKVTTTLDGKTQLPHRIRWAISIGLRAAQVGGYAFQIDGKTRWYGNRVASHEPGELSRA